MKKIYYYIIAFFCSILLLPAINLLLNWQGISNYKRMTTDTFLFNTDFLVPPQLAEWLYDNGLSSNPKHVIVGKERWLFLSDHYNATLSEARGTAPLHTELFAAMAAARTLWETKTKATGGMGLYLMVPPDKHTIYPEFLPDWAQRDGTPNNTDIFFQQSKNDPRLIDLRAAMLANKKTYHADLYYKKDTHWNSYGAWVAYRALAKHIGAEHKGIKWLRDDQFTISEDGSRANGDLGNLLGIPHELSDNQTIITFKKPVALTQRDYASDALISTGDNLPIRAPKEGPLMVHSTGALNDMRVLWLTDSFGKVFSPYMAATFSNVLQQDQRPELADPAMFEKLIATYRPQLVIITVVERNVRDERFLNTPPN